MGRKKPTILRATPARLTTTRMREDDTDDRIGNAFLLLFQGQGCLNRVNIEQLQAPAKLPKHIIPGSVIVIYPVIDLNLPAGTRPPYSCIALFAIDDIDVE